VQEEGINDAVSSSQREKKAAALNMFKNKREGKQQRSIEEEFMQVVQ
jgi:hypothetical protein